MEWKQKIFFLKEALYVVHQDIFKEFKKWGVKNLIVTRNKLVATWMDRFHMSIIS